MKKDEFKIEFKQVKPKNKEEAEEQQHRLFEAMSMLINEEDLYEKK